MILSKLSRLNILRQLVLFFLLCLVMNCKPKEVDSNVYGFTKVEEIESQRLNSSDLVNKAIKMFVFKDHLFVYDQDQNYQFKVIDILNDQYLKGFGKTGNGPCELSFPVSLNWVNNNQGKISINNRTTFKIQNFYLDKLHESESENCENIPINLDTNFQVVAQLDSSTIIGTGLFEGKYAVQKIGEENAKSTSIGFPTTTNENVDYRLKAMAFQGQFLKHPSLKKVLSTSLYTFAFDIIEADENNNVSLVKRVQYGSPEFGGRTGSKISLNVKKGNKYGCSDATISNNYIYILYSGKSNEFEDSRESDIVFVYDWNGTPIKSLLLDKPAYKIAVDEKDQYLIAFINEKDPSLLKYKLD